ncbi:MAG: hypothetical protein CSB44_07175 [Gammaproteobacteria bacterium]|nr:MAG: hypothetical protein CSB44_07175 [Gammaproteobacteria bacterium]PIE36800.1 MAG: hypothetical protein CSA54_03215 [Gammaproteobacteria bacterium]
MSSQIVSPQKTPLVAIVIDTQEGYRRQLVRSARQHLRRQGFASAVIAVRNPGIDFLDKDDFGDICDSLYQLAARFDVAGTLLMSNLLGKHMSSEALVEFAARLSWRPLVNVGNRIDGVESVVYEMREALGDLMVHMLAVPERQNVAFIRGRRGNPDSDQVEAAFREAMAVRGLEIDESLVVDGGYLPSDAYVATQQLLARGKRFDAVIAASDTMAANAVRALQSHGISVPEQIVVSGIDDTPDSLSTYPPITTIRRFLYVQIEKAVLALVRQIRKWEGDAAIESLGAAGRNRTETARKTIVHRVPSRFVARESSAARGESFFEEVGEDVSLEESRQRIVQGLLWIKPPHEVDIEALVDALMATLTEGSSAAHEYMQYLLTRFAISEDNNHWWQHGYRQLLLAPKRVAARHLHPLAVRVIADAGMLFGAVLWSARSRELLEIQRQRQAQDELMLDFNSVSRREDVLAELRRYFRESGIERAWLVLLRPEETRRHKERMAELTLAHQLDDMSTAAALERTEFPLADLLPAALRGEFERDLLTVYPVSIGRCGIGYLVVDASSLLEPRYAALGAGIGQALRNCSLIESLEKKTTVLEASNTRLSKMATLDTLTGLPNRASFEEEIQRQVRHSRSSAEPLALLFFDLDGFKKVNDSFGHAVGDELLKMVAQRLVHRMRGHDQLFRLGGDEFVLILSEGVGSGATERVVQQVLDCVSTPYRIGAHKVEVTTSIGIALCPEHSDQADELVRFADEAMYHAKHAGRNGYAIHDARLDSTVRREWRLLERIRQAVIDKQFGHDLQPRRALAEAHVTGFVLRPWLKGDDGERIDEAHWRRLVDSGVIGVDIALNHVEMAIRQLIDWQNDGWRMAIDVPVSDIALAQEGFVDKLESLLAGFPYLEHADLGLLIPERCLVGAEEPKIKLLQRLSGTGLRLLIDGYGAGHSSIRLLGRVPVNAIIVSPVMMPRSDTNSDTNLVLDSSLSMDVDKVNDSILKAVVNIARYSGIALIADGVHDDSELEALQALGFSAIQGPLVGKPASLDAAEWLLEQELNAELDATAALEASAFGVRETDFEI